MHRYLVYSAYAWILLAGTLHFIADVVYPSLRHARAPGAETTLYYGLNSAFSLGQVAFGLLGVLVAWKAFPLVSSTPVMILSLVAALGWLTITFLFMGYWEPKMNMAIFCALVLAALVTR